MKTYVGVYPENGRITILRDYGGKGKEVFEKNIIKFDNRDETICFLFLSTVKRSFDDPPDYICILNNISFHKYMFISKAKKIDLKNFEIIEEYKAKSLEAIFESGYNLENNKIIWTCLKTKFCIWQGKFCVNNKYKALEDLMILSENKCEETLEITEYPPDVLIYENFEGNNINCDFISQLFPECKIFEFAQKNPTNCALIYAQFMEVKDYSDNFLKSERRKNSISENIKNKNFPITFIHVAIDISSKNISVSYYHKKIRKTFTFNVKRMVLNDDQTGWKQIEKKLKFAKSRLNGEFARIHFVSEEKEFCLQWAKKMGFEQIEVIQERKMRYDEVVSHLPLKLQESDIIWIQKKNMSDEVFNLHNYEYDIYEIWKGNEYQGDIKPIDLKEKPSALNHIPIYVITTKWEFFHCEFDQLLNPCVCEIKYSSLKDYFPKNCRLFFYKNQETFSNMLIKYTQVMADEYFTLIMTATGSINVMEHLKFHPKTKESSSPNNIKQFESDTTQLKESNIDVFKFFQFINTDNHPEIVGIDLGTSRCCAAVNRKNGIETVPLGHTGARLLPSYVSYDEENPICGEVVVNRLPQFSSSTIFDSKRIIGRSLNEIEININWPFRISLKDENKVIIEVKKGDIKIQKSAEEVSKDLLKYIKEKSEEFQGKTLANVVITVPAAFNESQKEATLNAAKLAGWNDVILLPEPIAAAYTYFMDQKIPENSTVLLFDLGGGTLDVCIFKTENNAIKIISNTGDSKLGGRDFDTVLFNYFGDQLLTLYGITLKKDKKFQLILECQNIKEDLSVLLSCNLNTDDYDPKIDKLIPINRTHFEHLTKPLLNRIQNIINSSLMNSNKNPEEINIILMVGGGSRMPMIKNLLKEIFPKAEQCIHQNPDEVVAIGAAYYACSIFKSAETAAEW